ITSAVFRTRNQSKSGSVNHAGIDVGVPLLEHRLAVGTICEMSALLIAERHCVNQEVKQGHNRNVGCWVHELRYATRSTRYRRIPARCSAPFLCKRITSSSVRRTLSMM